MASAPTPSASTGLGRRLAANTLHAAAGRLAGIVVWILYTPHILRALGAEGFALWSLFFALTGYLAALDFGLVQSTLRHVAVGRESGDAEEAGAFATLGAAGFVLLGLLWLALVFALRGPLLDWLRIPAAVVGEADFALWAAPAAFVLAGTCNVCLAVLQAHGRFDLSARVMLAIALQQALGMSVVLVIGAGFRGLVVNTILGWLLGALVAAWLVRGALPEFRWAGRRASLARARAAFHFGGAMQLSSLFAAVHLHLDKLLLSRFAGLASVTPYELGSRVALTANSVPQMLLLALLPEAAAMHAANDRERLRELHERADRWVLAAGAILLAALLGASDALFRAWLGPGHDAAILTLRALALGFAATLATGVGTSLVRAIGRPDLEAGFGALVVVLHVALSVWLVPAHGLAGAMIAWVASNVLGSAAFLWRLCGTMGWPGWRTLGAPHVVPLLAVALGAGVAWLVGRTLPPGHGLAAWVETALLAALAAGLAASVLVAARYVDWREGRSLALAFAGRGREAR